MLTVSILYPFPSFYFQPVSLYLKYPYCKQQTVGSIFLPSMAIFYLLIGVLSPFILYVIIDTIKFKSTVLLCVFYLLLNSSFAFFGG